MKGFFVSFSHYFLVTHPKAIIVTKNLVFTMLAITYTAHASQSVPTIDIHKINSSEPGLAAGSVFSGGGCVLFSCCVNVCSNLAEAREENRMNMV